MPFSDMERTWEVVGMHLRGKNSKSSIVPMATPAVVGTLYTGRWQLGGRMYESGAWRKVLRYKCITWDLSVYRCHVDAQEVIQRECRAQRMGIKTESKEVSQATQECKQMVKGEKRRIPARRLRKACGR